MTERICEQCRQPFFPREAKQRFCSRPCSTTFFQNERRDAVTALRQQRAQVASTYFDHAIADEDAPGGRFAKAPAHVVGSETANPLVAPAWSQEIRQLPDEPPLGFAVDEINEALGGIGGER